jgi:hypothetical protein
LKVIFDTKTHVDRLRLKRDLNNKLVQRDLDNGERRYIRDFNKKHNVHMSNNSQLYKPVLTERRLFRIQKLVLRGLVCNKRTYLVLYIVIRGKHTHKTKDRVTLH